jgi:gliding motility-associated-like protein
MIQKLRVTFALFILVSFFHQGIGRHIVGGDITYNCVNADPQLRRTSFRVEMYVYRDSRGGGAPFDARPSIGVYRLENGVWRTHDVILVNLGDNGPIEVNNANPCVVVPPNVGVDKGLYAFNVTLQWGFDYQIVYQRCCRNNTINNIRDPGDQGAGFNITISKFSVENCNNSPEFANFPPVVICNNKPLAFNHQAVDNDGDSLAYYFCSPTVAGGTFGVMQGENSAACNGVTPNPQNCPPPYGVVSFVAPYSVDKPMQGDPVITINERTGLISGTPRVFGQFVIGVCVKEYRNGELIGEIQRDFQFNVENCDNAFEALARAKDGDPKGRPVDNISEGDTIFVKSCGATLVLFENRSIIRSTTPVRYQWQFNRGSMLDTFNTNDLLIGFPSLGKFTGKLIINPGQEDCSDTANISVTIVPKLDADFSFDYDTCVFGPVQFSDQSDVASNLPDVYRWNFNNEGQTLVINPEFFFPTPGVKKVGLTVRDKNGCQDSISKNITFQPVPTRIEIAPDRFIGCEPVEIFFKNNSVPIDETYDITWDFGDGTVKKGVSPTHTYTTPGIFDVKVSIRSPINCYIERAYGGFIEIKDSPEAGFDYDPKEFNSFVRDITFTNQSIGADYYQWRFGEAGGSSLSDPQYSFPDTGIYRVIQYVIKENGCTDSTSALIDVSPVTTIHIPNAFTPNNDDLNDDFKITGYLEGIKSFSMKIFNRYGELLFVNEDATKGWNGISKGRNAPGDVYVYLIEYVSPREEILQYKGHVTLIR